MRRYCKLKCKSVTNKEDIVSLSVRVLQIKKILSVKCKSVTNKEDIVS